MFGVCVLADHNRSHHLSFVVYLEVSRTRDKIHDDAMNPDYKVREAGRSLFLDTDLKSLQRRQYVERSETFGDLVRRPSHSESGHHGPGQYISGCSEMKGGDARGVPNLGFPKTLCLGLGLVPAGLGWPRVYE